MIMLIMCVFFLMGVMTVESRTNRENNVQNTLKRATDNAVTSILENKSYSINNNEEFIATLTAMICNSLISNDGQDDKTTPDENLKLTIEIVEADYMRGLLSLNIVEEYTNPIGSVGTCEYATTVVFDEVKVYETYTINYYDANGILIESYIVRAGDVFPEPSSDIKSQYKITEWYTNVSYDANGPGAKFEVPEKVPADSITNNITKYEQYNNFTGTMSLYGNYVP